MHQPVVSRKSISCLTTSFVISLSKSPLTRLRIFKEQWVECLSPLKTNFLSKKCTPLKNFFSFFLFFGFSKTTSESRQLKKRKTSFVTDFQTKVFSMMLFSGVSLFAVSYLHRMISIRSFRSLARERTKIQGKMVHVLMVARNNGRSRKVKEFS